MEVFGLPEDGSKEIDKTNSLFPSTVSVEFCSSNFIIQSSFRLFKKEKNLLLTDLLCRM